MSSKQELDYFAALCEVAVARRWCLGSQQEIEAYREERRLLAELSLSEVESSRFRQVPIRSGYRGWSSTYDDDNGGFPMIELANYVLHTYLDECTPPCTSRPATVLDAACGTGRNIQALTDRGFIPTGVDVTSEMLDVARRSFPRTQFEEGDLIHIPFSDATFDLVICVFALSHLKEWKLAVAELLRTCIPGGSLCIIDVHPMQVYLGAHVIVQSTGSVVKNYMLWPGDVIRRIAELGGTIVHLDEPRYSPRAVSQFPAHAFVPRSNSEVFTGTPALQTWMIRKGSIKESS